MDAHTKHLEARHAELFAALADIHAGISHGTIRSLEQVQEITSRFIPAASRGAAPTNPATRVATRKEGA